MIDIALKEWASICELLIKGEQAVVIRKGGVHEDQGPGRFRLEHDRFALFPAWEHEYEEGLKPGYRDRLEQRDKEPESVTLTGFAEVACGWVVPSREAFDRLDELHAWAKPQIDMRFKYKPDRPVYLLALRVFRLESPISLPLSERHWGCRSWVPLEGDERPIAEGYPAMSPDALAAVIGRIDDVFKP